jgi:hypothetical protein
MDEPLPILTGRALTTIWPHMQHTQFLRASADRTKVESIWIQANESWSDEKEQGIERERECVCGCVWVWVCERERERERKRGGNDDDQSRWQRNTKCKGIEWMDAQYNDEDEKENNAQAQTAVLFGNDRIHFFGVNF